MRRKMDDPLAGLEQLIQEAADEALRLNPHLKEHEPMSDEEAARLDREREEEEKRLADVMEALGKLKPSETLIRDRGE